METKFNEICKIGTKERVIIKSLYLIIILLRNYSCCLPLSLLSFKNSRQERRYSICLYENSASFFIASFSSLSHISCFLFLFFFCSFFYILAFILASLSSFVSVLHPLPFYFRLPVCLSLPSVILPLFLSFAVVFPYYYIIDLRLFLPAFP